MVKQQSSNIKISSSKSKNKLDKYNDFINEVIQNNGKNWSNIRKKYKISFDKAKQLLISSGIPVPDRAQAAKEKRLSSEEALAREPVGTIFIGMDGSNYVFQCPEGHKYSKSVAKLGQGCPVGKSGWVRPVEDIEKELLNKGFILDKSTYINTKKPITAYCVKCNKKRTANLANYRKFDCTYCSMSGTSFAEQSVSEWLQSLGFAVESYLLPKTGPYKRKSIDIFIPEKNIGIDYAGLYWHNECSPTPRGRSYHKDKADLAKSVGIRLITLFEDEWKERNTQVKSRILAILGRYDRTVFARKCQIKQISSEEARIFCNTNHLQDGLKGIDFAAGLYYNKELIAVMAFGSHHRKTINGEIVLKRLCFKMGVKVIGGSNKLFSFSKKALKNMGYNKILSWSDNRWSEGDVYTALGFTLEADLPPDYSYVKGSIRYSKQSLKKTPEERLINKTEKELRQEQGYHRIWDCGKKRWVLFL
jgi:hypothetical protein